jgi:hypothetical protein
MSNQVADKDNYLSILDEKSAIETLELVRSILFQLKWAGIKLDDGWLEKPWRWEEVWIPALNGNLEIVTHPYMDTYYNQPDEN